MAGPASAGIVYSFDVGSFGFNYTSPDLYPQLIPELHFRQHLRQLLFCQRYRRRRHRPESSHQNYRCGGLPTLFRRWPSSFHDELRGVCQR